MGDIMSIDARTLLASLQARGIKLWVGENGSLRYRAPRGALTPELLGQLQEHRDALVQILSPPSPRLKVSQVSPVKPDAGFSRSGQSVTKCHQVSQVSPGRTVVSPEACPLCGATPEELELVRRRRGLEEALRAWWGHVTGCSTCTPGGQWCAEGGRLRGAYFSAWLECFGGRDRGATGCDSRNPNKSSLLTGHGRCDM